ncbi:MAG: helix-turn-helix domain-containing protein [Paramuribaculum sp.]|nr:helix-turn-helix domain-containing protein [Paramuribaculum sp.]
MVKIENETQYNGALKRVEELMLKLPDNTPYDDPEMVELTLLGNLVADYDEEHYSIGEPTLIEVIKLRMYEMGLNQASLAKLLGISPSRVCDYLSGKCEPTLKVARIISRKLNISPSIILGV